ncbi:hypothetical protein ASD15_26405 [Massilia sp. Root351]|jgi:hypothetical protein|uniref:hypothetical protein n=1 Tax=Massilia sp. Root351 TaxID=1736522 RepID=UPI00070DB177|nr:hypothetical protein [Massilia sp. Root351]KQV88618.1 hypothetical protein ASD15_26405 [Massilia sp. Root351]
MSAPRSAPPFVSRLLRYAWASPCTALGLCLAAPAFLFGARSRLADGVVEVALSERGQAAWLRRLPFTAITFGHCVIGTTAQELERLRPHEHEHVRQYERWGPVFLAAYPLESLWQMLRGRRAYFDNRFERQARSREVHL